MKFLIQHNLMNLDQLGLIKHAVEPFPHEFVGLIPFSREITSNEPFVGKDFIPYGSTLLTTVGLELGWSGLCFDLKNFDYAKAVASRNDMLNAGVIMPAIEAVRVFESMNPSDSVFIRPALDLKHFSGQVIGCVEAATWLKDAMACESSGTYQIDENLMIVIDTPKNIQAEWRWFIVDGQIVDGSMYRFRGQLIKEHELDEDVIAEAQELANGWLPHQCVVMDIPHWSIMNLK